MIMATSTMGEEYWEDFALQEEDIEFLYNHLLEAETPLTPRELVSALVAERIQRQKQALERQRTSGGELYQPKGTFAAKQKLIFPALGWKHGEVLDARPGRNPELGEFQVIQVQLEDGSRKEFASALQDHALNAPVTFANDFSFIDPETVLENYYEDLAATLEDELRTNPDFVRIAGRWFPRALLVDVNVGHLNLAEAVLDMAGGGPMPTSTLLEQIELSTDVNPKLVEFSMDLALEEDPRFDEVGPAGNVLWYLHRLEPPEVLEPPLYLRYSGIEHDRSILTKEMLAFERSMDDELSPIVTDSKNTQPNEADLCIIFPHWRSGTLPLSSRVRHLFPTAYESPRIRFMLVDGETNEEFPGWVLREKRYIFGLREWYEKRGVMPGSIIHISKGKKPGQVVIRTPSRRPTREWVRTVLIGSDGGIVFAMLKQIVSTPFDDRMTTAIPDKEAVDTIWARPPKEQPTLERIVMTTVRELAKLNPQSHVHASELYAAINIIRRCPPAPILSILASRPVFTHVGDLHYRISETEFE
jgi:hypothetical protein